MATKDIVTVPRVDEAPPDGKSIAELIYDRVEQIMAASNGSRLQAFRQISEETGRPQSSISTNYYRHARANGLARSRVAVRSQAAESGDVLAAARAALTRVNQLAEEVSSLQASLELLVDNATVQQAEAAVLNKMKRLLGS